MRAKPIFLASLTISVVACPACAQDAPSRHTGSLSVGVGTFNFGHANPSGGVGLEYRVDSPTPGETTALGPVHAHPRPRRHWNLQGCTLRLRRLPHRPRPDGEIAAHSRTRGQGLRAERRHRSRRASPAVMSPVPPETSILPTCPRLSAASGSGPLAHQLSMVYCQLDRYSQASTVPVAPPDALRRTRSSGP